MPLVASTGPVLEVSGNKLALLQGCAGMNTELDKNKS